MTARDADRSSQSNGIRERLEKVKGALEETNGKGRPSRVVYCTKCDEYAVGRDNYLTCDFLHPDFDEDEDEEHWDYHVRGDYEETSIHGYIQALEWVVGRSDDTESDQ